MYNSLVRGRAHTHTKHLKEVSQRRISAPDLENTGNRFLSSFLKVATHAEATQTRLTAHSSPNAACTTSHHDGCAYAATTRARSAAMPVVAITVAGACCRHASSHASAWA